MGGSCFQKDILNLVYICECEGLHECARYWQMVVDMNEHQKEHFTHKIISSLFNTVTNKKIAVFGFAFKKDTGDVRETPALKVVEMLLQDGAIVHVFDPKVKKEDAMAEFKYHNMEIDESRLVFCRTPQEAVEAAHAIAVLTEWDEFKQYPYSEFYNAMMKPAFLFDGRGILNHRELEEVGFEVHAIGKGRGPMAVSAFCRKAENAASAFTSRHHPCASEQFGAVQFAWLDKAADPHCFVLLDVCWCWKVVLHARPSPAWGLQRPSCFEHADYDQDVSTKK